MLKQIDNWFLIRSQRVCDEARMKDGTTFYHFAALSCQLSATASAAEAYLVRAHFSSAISSLILSVIFVVASFWLWRRGLAKRHELTATPSTIQDADLVVLIRIAMSLICVITAVNVIVTLTTHAGDWKVAFTVMMRDVGFACLAYFCSCDIKAIEQASGEVVAE